MASLHTEYTEYSLHTEYERLNDYWRFLEQKFAERNVPKICVVEYSISERLGWVRHAGKFRLCVGNIAVDDWKPVVDSPIDFRMLAVRGIPALQRELDKKEVELLAELQEANATLRDALQEIASR
jgi:hypothetical protein